MRAVVLLIAASATAASAEPYPRALVERPLVLPRGTLEGALAQSVETRADRDGTVTTSLSRARVTYGDGGLDLELAAAIVLDPDAAHPERMDHVGFGARFEARRDLVVAPSVAYAASTLSTRLGVLHRRAIGRGGIELGAAAGVDDGAHTFRVVGGTLRVRAQVAATVALEGRAAMSYLHDAAPDRPEQRHRFAQDFGVRALWSVTATLDALAAVDLLALDDDVKLYTLGIAVRGAP